MGEGGKGLKKRREINGTGRNSSSIASDLVKKVFQYFRRRFFH